MLLPATGSPRSIRHQGRNQHTWQEAPARRQLMKRIHRAVWNKVTRSLVAVAETVPARTVCRMSETIALLVESIVQAIVVVRGQKVLLDENLAVLYGVETRWLNEQVRRNCERFPADFMFELSRDEYADLMSQFATSKPGRGGRRKLPRAFTEHGAIMAGVGRLASLFPQETETS